MVPKLGTETVRRSDNDQDLGGGTEWRLVKIAYLSNSVIPSRNASSIHVMKMCQALARIGHEVTLIALDGSSGREPGMENPYAFYGVDDIFGLRVVPPWRHFGQGWVYSWRLFKALRAARPDLVYGRNLRGCVLASVTGYPTVLELHTLNILWTSYDRLMFLALRRSGSLRRIVVISERLKLDLLDAAPIDARSVLVAHDGADLIRDHCRPPGLKQSATRLQVGYVGHIYPGRGLELILALARRLVDVDFHIVGGQAADIERVRRLVVLPDNVVLHGFLPYVQAEAFRAHCDVLIAPYQRTVKTVGAGKTETSRWMSPLKIFEYMAAGKPILCSDLPVLREILEHERTAWLAAPDDEDAWVDAVTRLAGDTELRRRLGEAARQELTDKYTWRGRANHVLQGIS